MTEEKVKEEDPTGLLDALITRRRPVMVRFKSMNEIMNKYGAWFDGYGNLCVTSQGRQEPSHITPSDFHYLRKTIEMQSHHSYPDWCID